MKKLLTSFIILSFLFFSCTNPIDKKKKELKNLKITVSKVLITKYNMVLIPPLPKIYFNVILNVENENEDAVTIEKFNFKILTNYQNKENFILGTAKNPVEHEFAAKEKRELELAVVTTLEDNADEKVYKFVAEILKSLVLNKEMEFLLEGTVEYNTFLGKINVPVSHVFKTRARP